MISSNSLDRYTLLQQLGDSTFGYLDLARENSSGSLFVIKTLEKARISDQNDIDRIMREILILRKLAHKSIIQMLEIVETTDYLHLVLEYAEEAMDLQNYISVHNKLSEEDAFSIFKQIISALEYIHSQNIAHRDLKPENILITKLKEVKIIGFGLSNFYTQELLMKTPCGSSCYAAPEVLAGKLYSGPKADIWSVGVVLYSMLVGKLPFEDDNTVVLYEKILKGDYDIPDFVSEEAEDVLRSVLEPNPSQRISLPEIKVMLGIEENIENDKKNIQVEGNNNDNLVINNSIENTGNNKIETKNTNQETKKIEPKGKRKTMNFVQANKMKVSRFSLFAPSDEKNIEKSFIVEEKPKNNKEITNINDQNNNLQEKKNIEKELNSENKRSKTMFENKNSDQKNEKDRRKTQFNEKSGSDIKKKRFSEAPKKEDLPVILINKDNKTKDFENSEEKNDIKNQNIEKEEAEKKEEKIEEQPEKREKSKSFSAKKGKVDEKTRRATHFAKNETPDKGRRVTEIPKNGKFTLSSNKVIEKSGTKTQNPNQTDLVDKTKEQSNKVEEKVLDDKNLENVKKQKDFSAEKARRATNFVEKKANISQNTKRTSDFTGQKTLDKNSKEASFLKEVQNKQETNKEASKGKETKVECPKEAEIKRIGDNENNEDEDIKEDNNQHKNDTQQNQEKEVNNLYKKKDFSQEKARRATNYADSASKNKDIKAKRTSDFSGQKTGGSLSNESNPFLKELETIKKLKENEMKESLVELAAIKKSDIQENDEDFINNKNQYKKVSSEISESYNIHEPFESVAARNSLINSRDMTNIVRVEENLRRGTTITDKNAEVYNDERSRRATAKTTYDDKIQQNSDIFKNKEELSRVKSKTTQFQNVSAKQNEDTERRKTNYQESGQKKGDKLNNLQFQQSDDSDDDLQMNLKKQNESSDEIEEQRHDSKNKTVKNDAKASQLSEEKPTKLEKEEEFTNSEQRKKSEFKQNKEIDEKKQEKIENMPDDSRSSPEQKQSGKNPKNYDINKRKSHTIQNKSQISQEEKTRRQTNFDPKSVKQTETRELSKFNKKEEKNPNQHQESSKESKENQKDLEPNSGNEISSPEQKSSEKKIINHDFNKRKSHTIQNKSHISEEEKKRRQTNFDPKTGKLTESNAKIQSKSNQEKETNLNQNRESSNEAKVNQNDMDKNVVNENSSPEQKPDEKQIKNYDKIKSHSIQNKSQITQEEKVRRQTNFDPKSAQTESQTTERKKEEINLDKNRGSSNEVKVKNQNDYDENPKNEIDDSSPEKKPPGIEKSSSPEPKATGKNLKNYDQNKRKSHTVQMASKLNKDEKNRRQTNYDPKSSKSTQKHSPEAGHSKFYKKEESNKNQESSVDSKGDSKDLERNLKNEEESIENPQNNSQNSSPQFHSTGKIPKNYDINKRKSHTVNQMQSAFSKDEKIRRQTNFDPKSSKLTKTDLLDKNKMVPSLEIDKKESEQQSNSIPNEEIIDNNKKVSNESTPDKNNEITSKAIDSDEKKVLNSSLEHDSLKGEIARPKSQTTQVKTTTGQTFKEENSRRATNYQPITSNQKTRRPTDIAFSEKNEKTFLAENIIKNPEKKIENFDQSAENEKQKSENTGKIDIVDDITEKTKEKIEEAKEKLNETKTTVNNTKGKSFSISYGSSDKKQDNNPEKRRQTENNATIKQPVVYNSQIKERSEASVFQTPTKGLKYIETEKCYIEFKEFSSHKNDIILLEKSEKKSAKESLHASPEKKSLKYEEAEENPAILPEQQQLTWTPEKNKNKSKSIAYPSHEKAFIEDSLIKRKTLQDNFLSKDKGFKNEFLQNSKEKDTQNQGNEASNSQSFSTPDRDREDSIRDIEKKALFDGDSFRGKNQSESEGLIHNDDSHQVKNQSDEEGSEEEKGRSENEEDGDNGNNEEKEEEIRNGNEKEEKTEQIGKKRTSVIEISTKERIYDILRKDRMSFYRIKKTLAQPVQEKEECLELNQSILSKTASDRKR